MGEALHGSGLMNFLCTGERWHTESGCNSRNHTIHKLNFGKQGLNVFNVLDTIGSDGEIIHILSPNSVIALGKVTNSYPNQSQKWNC